MSTREHAVKLLDSLTEEELEIFTRLFEDKNTLARLETDMLANDPNAQCHNGSREFTEEIRKVKPHKNIKELFEEYDGKYEAVNIDWGEPVGDEIW